ncbi:unnamed protein product [Linum trigynum]|uniref:B3 domain-containing protein n=1 Tax=Linum trigynum TaxID=586398 RepID=A0AAV2C709_9ROSI
MTESVAGRTHGRRSGGIRAGGNSSGLEFLADIARAVTDCEELCGCGHYDPRTCFLTVKKRKSLLLQTHHSLLLRNPKRKSPIKLVIKHHQPLPVQKPAELEVSVFPPPPPPAAVAPVSLPLPEKPLESAIPPASLTSSALALVPVGCAAKKGGFPLSSKARVSATVPPLSVSSPAMRYLPVGFAAQDDGFPSNLKARISTAVGGESVCNLGSTFTLVIRKRLTTTDLNPHHSRLSIPKSNARELFQLLTNREWAELRIGGRIKLGFFLDPDLEIASPTERSCLAIWKNGSSKVPMITGGGWKWVLKEQKRLNLKDDDWIELWSFRTVDSGELCLVLITADTGRRVAEKKVRGIRNGDYDEEKMQVVEQEAPAAAMGRIELGSSMDSSSNSSILTDEEEQHHPGLDLTLRLKAL